MAALDIDISLARRSFELRVEMTLGAETVTIVGPSGAGKSSLLRSVAGLERQAQGRVTLAAETWLDSDHGVRLSPERRRVGYVPQDYGLFPHMTVAANVRFAAGRNRPDLLERFGVAQLSDARPPQLSGGERQRVALARALARDPALLLLDEPFAALDANTRTTVRDELAAELRKLALPTLLVTHAFEDAAALADRVAVLDRGQIAQLARAEDLLRDPATAMVARLTGANVVAGFATRAGSGCTVSLDGGGELVSDVAAQGPVEVAIHPWRLILGDPEEGRLTDRVLSVHPFHGALLVKLARFTVQVPAGCAPEGDGVIVGLRARPGDVRVFGPAS